METFHAVATRRRRQAPTEEPRSTIRSRSGRVSRLPSPRRYHAVLETRPRYVGARRTI
ncbi:hypothetical protein BD626DRAFT_482612 [Schizophyllum amplum]|uniref:Uncharacterized protein n=1 Tax=Schizophyllum amplum TaxID=97359 RepID=A0A550CVC6_9AGAR|nr:hypothetical protein BD626DRAFT_482612 [Auriculariopsis ampla]